MNKISRLVLAIAKFFVSLLLVVATLLSCSNKQREKVESSVIIDVTGSNTHNLHDIMPSSVIKTIEVDKYNVFENNYRQTLITESFLSKKREFNLKARPLWLISNEYDRESQVNIYKQQITESLLEIKTDTSGRASSSVFIPIALELNRLASSDATKKTLIVFSDLLENSDWFTLVKKKNVNQLLKKPEKIEKVFMSEYKLVDNLQGIKVYLVYQPYIETETVYRKLSALYKKMLERRGATVFIVANL